MKRLTFILLLMASMGLVLLSGSAFATNLNYADPYGDVDAGKDPLPELTSMTEEEFAAMFVDGQPINNTYFPMTDTTVTRIFEAEGVDEDGEEFTERFELTNLVEPGRVILGVQTSIQFDRAFEDDLLVEETFDYYAQDIYDRVWYMGEDVVNYVYDDDDNLIETNTESAWIADGEEALPGWMMVNNPETQIDLNYYQEVAAKDEALDEATIWDLVGRVDVEGGSFDDVLRILEFDPFDEEWGYKYYAPDFGLIKEEEELQGLEGADFEPGGEYVAGLTFEYVGSRSVPEPGTFLLLGAGLLGLIGVGRKRTKK